MINPLQLVGRMVVVGAMIAAHGCAGPHVEAVPSGGVVTRSARTGLYTKKVVAKREPEMLFADDGTFCRVVPEVFRHTAVGASIRCNWQ